MIHFCCTRKVQELLGKKYKPSESPDKYITGLGNWYLHHFIIDNKNCVLFTHESTLYTVLIHKFLKRHLPSFHLTFAEYLIKQLKADKLYHEGLEETLMGDCKEFTYSDTHDNRKTLSALNDYVQHTKAIWEHSINTKRAFNEEMRTQINTDLNKIPMRGIKYKYPKEMMQTFLTFYGVTW